MHVDGSGVNTELENEKKQRSFREYTKKFLEGTAF
jgi:hypothetical protein